MYEYYVLEMKILHQNRQVHKQYLNATSTTDRASHSIRAQVCSVELSQHGNQGDFQLFGAASTVHRPDIILGHHESLQVRVRECVCVCASVRKKERKKMKGIKRMG